jgi:hypothetical protein
MLPDQRGQGAQIPGREPFRPLRLRQHLLQHEGVNVNHAVLEQVQCEHADFMVLAAIADHFASTGEEDEVVGAVPLLDDVQALVDFAAEVFTVRLWCTDIGVAAF